MTFDPTKPVQWTVYVLTNTANGKRYVGSTSNLPQRIRQHRHRASGCTALRNAIAKYGWDAFYIDTLSTHHVKESALSAETEAIAALMTVAPSGYNLSPTAKATYGYKWNIASRAKVSIARKGRKQSPETVAKRISHQIGRSLSEIHKGKLSEAKKGKKISDSHRANICSAKKGKAAWGARIRIDGVEYPHMKAAAEAIGVHKSTISWRAKQQWPGYEIVGRFALGA